MGVARSACFGGLHQSPVGEKANYYSGVCLESGEVEAMK